MTRGCHRCRQRHRYRLLLMKCELWVACWIFPRAYSRICLADKLPCECMFARRAVSMPFVVIFLRLFISFFFVASLWRAPFHSWQLLKMWQSSSPNNTQTKRVHATTDSTTRHWLNIDAVCGFYHMKCESERCIDLGYVSKRNEAEKFREKKTKWEMQNDSSFSSFFQCISISLTCHCVWDGERSERLWVFEL